MAVYMQAKPMTTIATIIRTASAASRYGVCVVDTPFTRFTVNGTEPTTTRSPTTTPSHQRSLEIGARPKTTTRPVMCNVVCAIDRLHSGWIDATPDAHGKVVDDDVADGTEEPGDDVSVALVLVVVIGTVVVVVVDVVVVVAAEASATPFE